VSEIITFWIDRSGDLYISSWINTIFYACSFVAAIYKQRSFKDNQNSYGERYFWLFLVFVLFALGINKQFDFQTMLIEEGRRIAQAGNWYEKRRLVQAWFAYGLFGVVATIMSVMLIRLSTREFWRHNTLAAIGLSILCFYLVLRTTSMSHVGFIADSNGEGELRLTDIIEFVGILCIFVNTLTRRGTEVEKASKRDTSRTAKRGYWFSWGLYMLIGVGMIIFFRSLHSLTGAHGFTIGHWNPGIGDSSFMGWFTVYSYYVTAGVCFLKLFTPQGRQQGQERTFWMFICLSMTVLGVIKQFNLLVAVDEILRIIARSGGVYEQRRTVQALVMAALCVVFILTVIRVLRMPIIARHKTTTIGFLYLFLFVLFRGISLHQFEDLLGYEILGVRVNWIAELMGVYWICLSSFLPLAAGAASILPEEVSAGSETAEDYISHAEIYGELEDYEKMFKDADKAIKSGLKSPEAYAGRGLALAMLDKYEESVKDLKIAARLGHQEAQEALTKQGIHWKTRRKKV
jgi:hypothetical protein